MLREHPIGKAVFPKECFAEQELQRMRIYAVCVVCCVCVCVSVVCAESVHPPSCSHDQSLLRSPRITGQDFWAIAELDCSTLLSKPNEVSMGEIFFEICMLKTTMKSHNL